MICSSDHGRFLAAGEFLQFAELQARLNDRLERILWVEVVSLRVS